MGVMVSRRMYCVLWLHAYRMSTMNSMTSCSAADSTRMRSTGIRLPLDMRYLAVLRSAIPMRYAMRNVVRNDWMNDVA